jgi:hypothetical protein
VAELNQSCEGLRNPSEWLGYDFYIFSSTDQIIQLEAGQF